MNMREIRCSSVLNKSGIPGVDYCVNPYTGCGHGCRYCYAEFMKRYTSHKEPWGSFVDVKMNAPEVLEKQLKNTKRGSVYFSSVTDPYQPLERKHELTRKCLEILAKHHFPVSIQTKSSLILRDLELIRKLRSVEVGFTICMNDTHARELEPSASPPTERILALKALHEAGIRTYVFLGPIIPHVTDVNDVAKRTYEWADHYLIDRLNMKGCALKNMKRPESGYYDKVKAELSEILKNKPHTFCF